MLFISVLICNFLVHDFCLAGVAPHMGTYSVRANPFGLFFQITFFHIYSLLVNN